MDGPGGGERGDSGRDVDLTLLVCTYNRAQDLREMLQTALAQETGGTFTFEILVIDNNSTDDTRASVEAVIAAGHTNVRYLFEARQGKSYALNTGLAAARGSVYTITDDDFILPPGWAKRTVEAFRADPGRSFVGGKVLPVWQGAVPAWLGPELWSSVALCDYGDTPFSVDSNNPICLLACAFRTADVAAVGGYRLDLAVSKGLIGGVEDVEILQRLWQSGRRGMYVPDIVTHHKVQASRLVRGYHRRWHEGHGRFYAVLRDAEMERSAARLFDVPAHMYARAAASAVSWLGWRLRRPYKAFEHEMQLRFFAGFFRERRRQQRTAGHVSTIRELAGFVRAILNKKLRRAPDTR